MYTRLAWIDAVACSSMHLQAADVPQVLHAALEDRRTRGIEQILLGEHCAILSQQHPGPNRIQGLSQRSMGRIRQWLQWPVAAGDLRADDGEDFDTRVAQQSRCACRPVR